MDLKGIDGGVPRGQRIQELVTAAESLVNRMATSAGDVVDSIVGEQS